MRLAYAKWASPEALIDTQDYIVKRRDAFTKRIDLFVYFGGTKNSASF